MAYGGTLSVFPLLAAIDTCVNINDQFSTPSSPLHEKIPYMTSTQYQGSIIAHVRAPKISFINTQVYNDPTTISTMNHHNDYLYTEVRFWAPIWQLL